MRILFFIETGGPGGAEQVVLQLAKGFRDSGHTVAVVTLRTGWLTEQLASESIQHELLDSSSSLDIGLPFKLAKILKNYDILHTHLFDSGVYGAMAARIAAKPHLSTEHGDIHHINKRKFSSVKLKLLKWCNTYHTAVSNFTREALVSRGIAAGRVCVVGNPVRSEQFNLFEGSLSDLGIDGIADKAFIWTHVANHRLVKDQRTLLEGFANALSRTQREQVLLLIGDGPEREDLEQLVKDLGIEKQVYFLGFRNDVQKLLSAANGCILSSKSEALPMSLLEAGALGLLMISSDVGGVRDIITPGESGLLFPVSAPESLGEEIAKVVDDSNLLSKLKASGQAHIRDKFLLTVVLKQYQEAYSRI